MKQCNKCKLEKDESEFSKNSLLSDGLQLHCKNCVKEYKKEYYINNKDKIKDKIKEYTIKNKEKRNEYLLKNKDKFKELHKEYCLKNKDKFKEQKKEYRLKNKDILNQYSKNYRIQNKNKIKEYSKEYQKNNSDKINALNTKRRALKKRALSPDRNDKLIEVFYQQRKRLSKCLGISFEVDHILPLSKGGKHHENNLQVIPAVFNSQKKDSLDYKCPYPNFKIHEVVVTQSK